MLNYIKSNMLINRPGAIIIFLLLSCSCSSGRKEISTNDRYYLNFDSAAHLHSYLNDTIRNSHRINLLSAHRGGAGKELPENSLETFENTLKYTYSIIEVDPRYSKDSVIVLHHDKTLDRTTTGTGLVSDYTYEELQKLFLRDIDGNVTPFKIPTLEEALKWAKGKSVLVLDKKDVSVEDRLRAVEECDAEANAIIMAYTFEEARHCYAMNKDVMMQIFINNQDKVLEFDNIGVPWKNVIVFVTHEIPESPELFNMINSRGSTCVVGTSRTLDKELMQHDDENIAEIRSKYESIHKMGAGIIETDVPINLSKLITTN